MRDAVHVGVAPALRGGGRGGGGRGSGDVTQRWLAVRRLGSGGIVPRRAWAPLPLGAGTRRRGHDEKMVEPTEAVYDIEAIPCLIMACLLAGARRALIHDKEEPGRADLLELSLFTGVEEDHG